MEIFLNDSDKEKQMKECDSAINRWFPPFALIGLSRTRGPVPDLAQPGGESGVARASWRHQQDVTPVKFPRTQVAAYFSDLATARAEATEREMNPRT